MLKDKLQRLSEESLAMCRFGKVCRSLDKDTLDALLGIMRTPTVSSRSITNLLNEEGYSIGNTSLNEARQCVNGQQPSCKGCIPGVTGK